MNIYACSFLLSRLFQMGSSSGLQEGFELSLVHKDAERGDDIFLAMNQSDSPFLDFREQSKENLSFIEKLEAIPQNSVVPTQEAKMSSLAGKEKLPASPDMVAKETKKVMEAPKVTKVARVAKAPRVIRVVKVVELIEVSDGSEEESVLETIHPQLSPMLPPLSSLLRQLPLVDMGKSESGLREKIPSRHLSSTWDKFESLEPRLTLQTFRPDLLKTLQQERPLSRDGVEGLSDTFYNERLLSSTVGNDPSWIEDGAGLVSFGNHLPPPPTGTASCSNCSATCRDGAQRPSEKAELVKGAFFNPSTNPWLRNRARPGKPKIFRMDFPPTTPLGISKSIAGFIGYDLSHSELACKRRNYGIQIERKRFSIDSKLRVMNTQLKRLQREEGKVEGVFEDNKLTIYSEGPYYQVFLCRKGPAVELGSDGLEEEFRFDPKSSVTELSSSDNAIPVVKGDVLVKAPGGTTIAMIKDCLGLVRGEDVLTCIESKFYALHKRNGDFIASEIG